MKKKVLKNSTKKKPIVQKKTYGKETYNRLSRIRLGDYENGVKSVDENNTSKVLKLSNSDKKFLYDFDEATEKNMHRSVKMFKNHPDYKENRKKGKLSLKKQLDDSTNAKNRDLLSIEQARWNTESLIKEKVNASGELMESVLPQAEQLTNNSSFNRVYQEDKDSVEYLFKIKDGYKNTINYLFDESVKELESSLPDDQVKIILSSLMIKVMRANSVKVKEDLKAKKESQK